MECLGPVGSVKNPRHDGAGSRLKLVMKLGFPMK